MMPDFSKATPRPWRHDGDGGVYGPGHPVLELCDFHWWANPKTNDLETEQRERSNADLTVHAVNLHDELVAALRRARSTLWTALRANVELKDFDPIEHATIKAIDAVLAKVDAP